MLVSHSFDDEQTELYKAISDKILPNALVSGYGWVHINSVHFVGKTSK